MKYAWACLVSALPLLACAEAEPGIPPPEGQLYFPLGLAVADPSGSRPLLVVGSSNFDQRYNSGFVSVFDLGKVAALVPTPTDGSVTYRADFGDALLDQVRVLQLGGPILHVPAAASGLSGDRVYVAARAANRITALRLGADGLLSCNLDGDPAVPLTDCSERAVLPTGFDDPFSLAFVPGAGNNGSVAVSHLGAITDGTTRILSALTNVDLARWEQHQAGPAVATTDLNYPLVTKPVEAGAGFSGLVYVPGGFGGESPALLAASIEASTSLPLLGLTPRPVSADDARLQLSQFGRLNLDAVASAIQLRGLTVDGNRRAYVSMRFAEGSTTFNSGIGVIDLTGALPRLMAVFEVGNELAQPVLSVRGDARWLYVPDLRDDRIWVLDVRSDLPSLIAEIKGRAERTIDGEVVEAKLFSTPTDLLFAAPGDGRQLLLVGNFSNSTLAVVDVTSPDPRLHRVIGRLGRDLDGAGKSEGDQ